MKLLILYANVAKLTDNLEILLKNWSSEDKPSDVLFYCIVRWLSTSNVLRRVVELLDPIIAFLKEIKKPFPQLENDDWIQDLIFFTDIMQHLNTLNLALQGKDKLLSDLSQTVFGFQNKIRISKTIYCQKNSVTFLTSAEG